MIDKIRKLTNRKNDNYQKILANDNLLATNIDEKVPWYLTVIFLLTVVMPLIIVRIIPIEVKAISSIFFYLPLIGFIVSMRINAAYMIKTGAWSAYLVNLATFIASFTIVPILLIAFKLDVKTVENVKKLIKIGKDVAPFIKNKVLNFLIFLNFFQNLLQFSFIILLIISNKNIKERIIFTIKNTKKRLLAITLLTYIGFILTIKLISLLYEYFSSEKPITSDNEELLNLLLNHHSFFFILIVIIFLAPITEEFVYRHGYFAMFNSKIVGFLVSTICFVAIHLQYFTNWWEFFSYFIPATFIAGSFLLTKKNISYPILFHFLNNLFSVLIKL